MKKIEFLFLGIIAAIASFIFLITAAITLQILMQKEGGITPEIYFYSPFFILVAALVEEFFKYNFINKKIFTDARKKILTINTIFFGLGFSFIEAVFILTGNYSKDSVYLNIFEISLIHISTSLLIMEMLFRSPSKNTLKILPIVILTSFLHLIYNFLVLSEIKALSFTLSITLLAVAIFLSIRKQKNTLA